MAIDSAEKRRSVSGIGWLIPGVTPNSSKDREWRQQSGWSYSGIAPDGPLWPGNASVATLGPANATVATLGPANAVVGQKTSSN